MIVLGGGAVGCELGQMLARFGVAVMIVEAQERLLPAEEPEASELLGTVFRGEGIAVHAEARFERIAAWGSSLVAVLEAGTQLSADRLLVVTGRAASLDGLGLETAGVDGSSGYVQVDGRLRAGEGVWAIGDAPGEACSRTRPCTRPPSPPRTSWGRTRPRPTTARCHARPSPIPRSARSGWLKPARSRPDLTLSSA